MSQLSPQFPTVQADSPEVRAGSRLAHVPVSKEMWISPMRLMGSSQQNSQNALWKHPIFVPNVAFYWSKILVWVNPSKCAQRKVNHFLTYKCPSGKTLSNKTKRLIITTEMLNSSKKDTEFCIAPQYLWLMWVKNILRAQRLLFLWASGSLFYTHRYSAVSWYQTLEKVP